MFVLEFTSGNRANKRVLEKQQQQQQNNNEYIRHQNRNPS